MIQTPRNDLRGGKITVFKTLIVEDSAFYRQLLKEALHSRFPSMELFEAADGEEAFRKIETCLPNLVFMDIKLPGESGLELTKKIKTQYPNIIIIILTAYDIPEYREAAVQTKANYFLSKGSSSKEGILKLVESILAGR
jgi:DNA-binding NarL/FixJ family response regulator